MLGNNHNIGLYVCSSKENANGNIFTYSKKLYIKRLMIAKEIILSYIRSDLSVLPVWGENAENAHDQKSPCTPSWLTYQSSIIKEEDVDKVFGRSAAIGVIGGRYRDWEKIGRAHV